MQICGYEKFSMVDYDGKIACTVFTNGCNMRCPFCHNVPLVVDTYKNNVNLEEEVLEYLKLRRGLVDAVCISGGEPTLQQDLEKFVLKVKELGYKVKLDTNGLNPNALKKLLDKHLLDYVAMDVKNSLTKYGATSGIENVSTEKIEKSIKIIIESGVDYEFRTTLISELHTETDISEISKLIKGAKKYFLQKYKDTESCILHGYTAVPLEVVEGYKTILESKIDFVGLRGY